MRRVLVPLVLLPVLLAGCGGGSDKPSDADQAKTAAQAYTKAFASGDAKKACSLLTPQGRLQAIQNKKSGLDTCEKVFTAFHDEQSPASLKSLRDAKPGATKVFASKPLKATVKFSAGVSGSPITIDLRKVGGRWLVDQDQ